MNKIYKVIWSKVKGAYIVVSELAKGYTRAKTSKRIFSRIVTSSVITLMISAGIFVTAPANVFAGAAEVFGGSSHEVGKFYYYYDESDGHYIILNNKYLRSDGAGGYTYTVGNKVYSTKDSTLLEYFPGEYKDDDSVIVGGQGNSVYARRSGIFSGLNNRLMGSASESAIIGGWSNSMGYSHDDDLVSVSNSVILGGSRNFMPSGHESSIIGGENNTLSGHGAIVGSDDSLLVNGSGGGYSGYAVILGGENGYASYNSISIGGGYAAKGMAIGEYASNNKENTISFGHKIGDKFLNTVVTSNVGQNGYITDEDGNVLPMDGALRTVPKGHTYTANLRGDTYTLKAGDSYICFGNSSYLYIHDTYDDEQTTRLTNISAGEDQTDAVNVSQLISKGNYNSDTKKLTLQSNSGSSVQVDLSALSSGTTYTAGDGIIISSDVISVKKDGTVTEGNTDAVTGGAVYDAIKDKANVTYIDAELANKADTDLGNINDDGKGVIGNIAEEALADDLNAKANVNASNVADHTAEWGAAIGTGAVEDGNGELVTGGTVFNAVKGKADIAYVDNELLTKADVDLSNITEGGQTVIQNIAKGSVKLENGTNTTVSSTDNADGSLTYKVNVEGNGVAEEGNTGLVSGDTLYNTVNEITTNIDADLEGKANADASNVANHTAEWGAAIGTGVVEDGNGELVTGDTVYEAVKDKADKDYVDEQLAGKADTDLGNLTDEGKDVIKDIAKDTVKVEDGLNTTVSSTENADGSISYQVNVEGNGVAEAGNTGLINGDTLYNTVEEINKNITNVTEGINAELDGKANADASNVADHTAEWGAAIGTGKVEAGNGELVTGDTVYNAVKDKADADFGNITDEGKDVIGDIAQEALQDDLDGKANIDASNIETDKWADKLGTGTIVDGDKNLVNGDTVYDAIKNMGGGLVMSDGKTITVGKDDGATVIDVSKHNGDGNTENRVITGVATDANDMSSAANVGYVNQSVGQLANDFNRGLSELDSQMKKGVAGAAALAALNPLDYDPENKLNFAAGVGSYKGESATALGMFYRPNENVMFSLGGAFGNGENMWNAGITFNLDKPSASTSKAAMARAIKTMAAENDALEAKTAEQDAKIALLTEQVEALLAAQEK